MERLIKGTSAYKIFTGDAAAGKLSHAYMLYFADGENIRSALKLFALRFFGEEEDTRGGRLILGEGLTDCKFFPAEGSKLTADTAAQIVDDAVKRPLEYDKKLYVITSFESASAIVQNKLLKILEEPPAGVYFLLGATSLSPVLGTVISRVKLLEVPPFSQEEILGALERAGQNPKNAQAAAASGGVLGRAQNVLKGGWYEEVKRAAEELCASSTAGKAAVAAVRHGDTKYKTELLAEMQRIYFGELKKYAADENYRGALTKGATVFAANAIGGALRDVKFNANFSALLYDFTLRVAAENEKW